MPAGSSTDAAEGSAESLAAGAEKSGAVLNTQQDSLYYRIRGYRIKRNRRSDPEPWVGAKTRWRMGLCGWRKPCVLGFQKEGEAHRPIAGHRLRNSIGILRQRGSLALNYFQHSSSRYKRTQPGLTLQAFVLPLFQSEAAISGIRPRMNWPTSGSQTQSFALGVPERGINCSGPISDSRCG